jgi:DUF1009 family protein
MSQSPAPLKQIGLIAGSRSLPLLFAREARALGVGKIVAVAFENETDPALASLVDEIVWLKVGQLARMIEAFTNREIRQCVMLGQIAPNNLFNLRPDLRAVKLLFRLKEKNAHTIFGAIADELEQDGVELIESLPWLHRHMPGAGFTLGPALAKESESDVAFGLRMAKEISRLEIGQTVVVKDGVVLAVEGFEGTDACLTRGGSLAGKKGGAVAAKVAKENHDLRFDIPCFGPTTVETCARAGIGVFAFEAGKTLVLDRDQVDSTARRLKVSVISASP